MSITLDQGNLFAKDVPLIGKDSLGIWLSDWGWNSRIGKERWQEAMALDLCRGSLLLQPWSDKTWLTVPEREEFARFARLLRQHPECFIRPQLVLGDPWKHEPYGYACTDGKRGFLVINNFSWADLQCELLLNERWGLSSKTAYHLYRHYPRPAHLTHAAGKIFRGTAQLATRPFEVVLLEVVPVDRQPTTGQPFVDQVAPAEFKFASRPIELQICEAQARVGIDPPVIAELAETNQPPPAFQRTFAIRTKLPIAARDAMICLSVELTRDGRAAPMSAVGK